MRSLSEMHIDYRLYVMERLVGVRDHRSLTGARRRIIKNGTESIHSQINATNRLISPHNSADMY